MSALDHLQHPANHHSTMIINSHSTNTSMMGVEFLCYAVSRKPWLCFILHAVTKNNSDEFTVWHTVCWSLMEVHQQRVGHKQLTQFKIYGDTNMWRCQRHVARHAVCSVYTNGTSNLSPTALKLWLVNKSHVRQLITVCVYALHINSSSQITRLVQRQWLWNRQEFRIWNRQDGSVSSKLQNR